MKKGEVYYVGGKRIHEIFACCEEEAAAIFFEGMFDDTSDVDNIKVSRHLSLYRSKRFNRQKFVQCSLDVDLREIMQILEHTRIHQYVLENAINKYTAFHSAEHMIQDAIEHPGYRPTLHVDSEKILEVLADYYDDEMKKNNIEKRAYRSYKR